MATGPENIDKIFALTVKIENIADSRPPRCKAALYGIANAIRSIAVDFRRRPQHRGPVKSDKMTPAKRSLIWQLKQANPDMSHQEIAAIARVNTARVSETLYGKRK